MNHFTNLFSSTSPHVDEESLELFPLVISAKENLVLCSIPIEVEVFQALSSLGSSKASDLDGFTAFFYKNIGLWLDVKF